MPRNTRALATVEDGLRNQQGRRPGGHAVARRITPSPAPNCRDGDSLGGCGGCRYTTRNRSNTGLTIHIRLARDTRGSPHSMGRKARKERTVVSVSYAEQASSSPPVEAIGAGVSSASTSKACLPPQPDDRWRQRPQRQAPSPRQPGLSSWASSESCLSDSGKVPVLRIDRRRSSAREKLVSP